MKRLVVAFMLFSASTAYALPTPSVKSLVWTYEDSSNLSGFYIYFALESDPQPRNYTDVNRMTVGPMQRNLVLLSVKPDAEGDICFRMTAAKKNLEGVESESGFTPEICGDFGIRLVTGFGIE